jgi:hypothetical protein
MNKRRLWHPSESQRGTARHRHPGARFVRRRPFILLACAALVLQVLAVAAAAPASATVFVEGVHVTADLKACNNDGTIVLPNGSGDFICDDADYQNGNLGKGWNELDLVPHRLQTDLGTQAAATTDYNMYAAADYQAGATPRPGYDFISDLQVNSALSDASCSISTGTATTTSGGGTLVILSRLLTIHQAKGTSCFFDYYQRLALGSHLFPGASLQSYAFSKADRSGANGTLSLPVNQIAPQSISKDMTATQDSDHVWDVTKSPTPASLSFTNTCDPTGSLSQSVAITVSWTKHAASPSGVITVLTHVYATNPASRSIDTSVTDVIYSGTTALDTSSAGPITVPANTASFLLLTHSITVPAGTTNLNDIATGTYADTVTGIPIPGTTTATASATVQSSGVENNASATITDVESITGTGLSYSVDGFSGASGGYDNGYVEGTPTTGNVSWTSDSQSSTGSVTLNKTVYASAATVDSTGGLSDTATLTGVDGFTTDADLTVDVSTDASTSLSISKTTDQNIATAQVFTFHLFDGSTNTATGDTATVNMPALSNGPVSSNVISGLSPTGTYYFHEDATAPYAAQDTSSVTFSLTPGDASTCSAVLSVSNTADAAHARVRKITDPASSGLWTFTLTGPNSLSETLNNVQAGAGYASFASDLDVDGGTYTITETAQTGYDLTGVVGDFGGVAARVTTNTTTRTCSFTLNLVTDSTKTLSCTFTNTQQGTIIVRKVTNPVGAAGSFTFTGDAAGSIGDGGTITVNNLAPGTYTSTEANPTPAFDLTGIVCDDGASATASSGSLATRTATFKLDPGETVTCTFTNRQRGHARVVKTVGGAAPTGSQAFTFQLRSGASASSAGTILETATANAGNGGVINFSTYLVPGTTYQLCEQMMPGWLTSLGPPFFTVYNPSGDNSVVCTDFTVTAGQLKIFNIDNTAPPGGRALTIGFWKNWASCAGSNGKQHPVLDQTLLAAANSGFPITIGLLVLDPNVLGAATACKYAVNLLNKSTITSGKKKASDPLFNLAAQLLAADLNIAAGAGSCPSAVSAINAAQALLVKYNFDGNTYSPKLTAADATLANSLATTLDKYNNNTLC